MHNVCVAHIDATSRIQGYEELIAILTSFYTGVS